ncbi:MAG TPA: response regulator [Nitrospirae bacterium]|nr:transcriptional regulatory protein ZraR [bacterium BMS3Abin10]HDK17651.1 response regulator [Nitrospirota bacterium]HDZ83782.1 response regulator [Nitrospirota bacterium]
MEKEKYLMMVVDDEPIVGKRLKQIFEKAGYNTEVFTGGRSALEDLKKKKYDIVVTDLRMDDVDGIKILEEAREKNPDIKVIIITAYAEMETAKEAFKKGAFDFIAKPFKIDELKQVIARAEKELAKSRE